MPTLKEREAWSIKHVRSKEGRKFSLAGRAWVTEHFWRPADGWKVVAKDITCLCDQCKDQVTAIKERWDWDWVDKQRRHVAAKKGECSGLRLAPILVTVLNLPRREGKTFNVCVFLLTTIFLSMRRFVLFLATAGDQTERLFADNIDAVIDQSDAMREACDRNGWQVRVPSTGSRLDVAKTTSHKTITGGGYSHIVLEEARDLDPRTVAAAVLSIRDQGGYECPRDARHVLMPGIGGEPKKQRCPKCGDWLHPWYPRVIVPSSSGIVEDSERDWFNQLVELLESDCPANYYVHRSEESTNPVVSKETTNALAEGFGRVEALKTYMDVELTNRPRRKGDDFVSQADLDRITDESLSSLEGSDLQCVGYLDTSWSSDLTSFLIAGWDPESSSYPWQQLRLLHWTWWEPKKLPGRTMRTELVREHFERYIPNFPALELVLVDDRGMTWAKELVHHLNTERRGWGMKVRLFHGKRVRHRDGRTEQMGARIPGVFGGADDRSRAWQLLEERIFGGRSRIVIPRLDRLHRELLGVTKVQLPEGGYEIRDRNRKKRHADLADGLAGCAFLAYLVATNQRRRLDKSHTSGGNSTLAQVFGPGVTKGFGFDSF